MRQVTAAFLMSSDSLSRGVGLLWVVPPAEQQCFQPQELAKRSLSLGCSFDKVMSSPLKCRQVSYLPSVASQDTLS